MLRHVDRTLLVAAVTAAAAMYLTGRPKTLPDRRLKYVRIEGTPFGLGLRDDREGVAHVSTSPWPIFDLERDTFVCVSTVVAYIAYDSDWLQIDALGHPIYIDDEGEERHAPETVAVKHLSLAEMPPAVARVLCDAVPAYHWQQPTRGRALRYRARERFVAWTRTGPREAA